MQSLVHNPIVNYILEGLRLEFKHCHPLEDTYPNAWCHVLDLMLQQDHFREQWSYRFFARDYFVEELNTLSASQHVQLWQIFEEEQEGDTITNNDKQAGCYSLLSSNKLAVILEGLWNAFLYWDSFDLDTEMEDASIYIPYRQIPYRDQLDTIPGFVF